MFVLPETVIVLNQTYEIKLADKRALKGDYGKVSFDKQIIYLSKHISGNFLRETLLHEILHIIDYSTSGSESDVKERDIHGMSSVLFSTMINNPDVVEAIFTVDE